MQTEHNLLRRFCTALTSGLIIACFVTTTLCLGALSYAHGWQSWYSLGAVISFVFLGLSLRVFPMLDEMFNVMQFGTAAYHASGRNIALLALSIVGSCVCGWLLANGHKTLFRLFACIPSIAIATIIARWFIDAPDAKYKNGKLRLAARVAVVSIYLTVIILTLTLSEIAYALWK